MKKVFISYSRKNDKEVFEFRSNEKFREFEILIDDEDIKFDTQVTTTARVKALVRDTAGNTGTSFYYEVLTITND